MRTKSGGPELSLVLALPGLKSKRVGALVIYHEQYDGDHTNKVRERIERNVLPFFATRNAMRPNPTDPQIQP